MLLKLGSQITSIIRVDTSGNDRSADATCSSKRNPARDKYMWNILVFAEKREMHEDRERSGIAN
jgi:hypothetical protein